jgi:cytochrome c1
MTKAERAQAIRRLEAAGYQATPICEENGRGRVTGRGVSVSGQGANKIFWEASAVRGFLLDGSTCPACNIGRLEDTGGAYWCDNCTAAVDSDGGVIS